LRPSPKRECSNLALEKKSLATHVLKHPKTFTIGFRGHSNNMCGTQWGKTENCMHKLYFEMINFLNTSNLGKSRSLKKMKKFYKTSHIT
jgi:hypothetical protein